MTNTFKIIIDSTGAEAGERRTRRSLNNIQKEAKETASDLGRLRKAYARSGKSATEMATRTDRASKALGGLGKNILAAGGVVFGLTAVVSAMKGAIETGTRFEKSIAELSAITGASGDDLKALSDQARELGKVTTSTATQVATGFKLIASAKPELLENRDALIDVTKAALVLSEASGLELPQAVKALTGSLNQFNAPASEAGRFINVLAAGSKLGAVEIPQLTQSLKVAGTVAAGSGLSFEETTAAIEALGEAELKGAEAGTVLRNIIIRLNKQGVEALSPTVVGLAQALRNLEKQTLAGLSPLERQLELEKIFGAETIAGGQALLVRTERLEDLTGAITGTTTAYEQQLIATNTLEDDQKRLASAYEGVELALADGVIPSTRSATQFLTNWLNVVSEGIDDVNEFAIAVGERLGGAFRTNEGVLRSLQDSTAEEVQKAIDEQQKLVEQLEKTGGENAAFQQLPFDFGLGKALGAGALNDARLQLAELKALQDEINGLTTNTPDAPGSETDEEAKRLQEQKQREAEREALSKKREAARKKDIALSKEQRQQERLGSEIVRDVTRDIEDQARSLQDLQESLEPVRRLNREYTESQQILNRALKEGTIEEEEWNAANVLLTETLQKEKNALNDVKEETAELTDEQKRQEELLTSLTSRTEDFGQTRSDLKQLYEDERISLEQLNLELEKLNLRQLDESNDFSAGVERGLIRSKESFNDFATTSEQVTVAAFGKMKDGLSDFTRTGKLDLGSFKDFAVQAIADIAAQAAISELFFGPSGSSKGGKSSGEGGGGLLGSALGIVGSLFSSSGGGSEAIASNAEGGIETAPTLSRVAEKGPEAIIPLKGGNVPVKIETPGSVSGGIRQINNFNIQTPNPDAFRPSQNQALTQASEQLARIQSRNGGIR